MPESSYYTGKSELLQWVNDILELQLVGLEELSNGAVYCQLFDAYFPETVNMHRVNYQAKKDYEVLTNYKIFQAAVTSVGFDRDLKAQGLVKGSQGELLDLLQWLYCVLTKLNPLDNYDPLARRDMSANGGIVDKIPLPLWLSNKPDGPKYEPHKKWDVSNTRTPAKNVPSKIDTGRRGKSRKKYIKPERATPLPQTQNTYNQTASRLASPPRAIPQRSKSRGAVQQGGVPRVKLGVVSNKTAAPKAALQTGGAARKMTMANTRSDQNADEILKDVLPHCVTAAALGSNVFGQSIDNLRTLIDQIGTGLDTYGCRAKLHSLRDAMSTLLNHTSLLLGDLLDTTRNLFSMKLPEPRALMNDLNAVKRELQDNQQTYEKLVNDLGRVEQINPVPRGTLPTGVSDQLSERTESDGLDSALRKVGAAKAALTRALQKMGCSNYVRSRMSYGGQGDKSAGPNGSVEEAEDVIAIGFADETKQADHHEMYRGQYVNGKKCGYGVYTFVNGDLYNGEFNDDEMHGYGLYTFSHEGHYEGQWVMGVYEGVGTETFALGSTYHGQYREGSRSGWGVCRYYNGDYYEGQWKEGIREGRGMQQCTDESNFVGDYLHGKRHGYGVYNFPNGDRYYGEYANDIPHGYGVYRFSNGQKYEGQWLVGKKHGFCVYTVETNGTWERWAGEWDDGCPVWVENLNRSEMEIANLHPDIRDKVQKALEACKRSQESGEVGLSRLDEHWKTDSHIQRSIREVVWKADKAAVLARDAQRKALEVAARLETK